MIAAKENACIKCGSCMQVCPVVTMEGVVSFPGPRGVAIDAARFGGDVQSIRLDSLKCTTCWRCDDVCPAKISLPRRILEIRRETFSKAALPAGHTQVLENIDRHRRSVHPEGSQPSIKPNRMGDLLYFPGCIAEQRLPAIYDSTLDLVGRGDRVPFVPESWQCCGAPLEKIGDEQRMKAVHEGNFAIFDKAKEIVTSCPGCTSHLFQGYGLRPMHTIEYLYEVMDVTRLSFLPAKKKIKVALHRPCHLNRTVGPHVIDYALEILQNVPGIKLVEMADPGQCCGGGGGVTAGHPDVALHLARAKVRSALEAKAEMIVAPCPFCVINLNRAGGIEVQDFVILLDSILKGH